MTEKREQVEGARQKLKIGQVKVRNRRIRKRRKEDGTITNEPTDKVGL